MDLPEVFINKASLLALVRLGNHIEDRIRKMKK